MAYGRIRVSGDAGTQGGRPALEKGKEPKVNKDGSKQNPYPTFKRMRKHSFVQPPSGGSRPALASATKKFDLSAFDRVLGKSAFLQHRDRERLRGNTTGHKKMWKITGKKVSYRNKKLGTTLSKFTDKVTKKKIADTAPKQATPSGNYDSPDKRKWKKPEEPKKKSTAKLIGIQNTRY